MGEQNRFDTRILVMNGGVRDVGDRDPETAFVFEAVGDRHTEMELEHAA